MRDIKISKALLERYWPLYLGPIEKYRSNFLGYLSARCCLFCARILECDLFHNGQALFLDSDREGDDGKLLLLKDFMEFVAKRLVPLEATVLGPGRL